MMWPFERRKRSFNIFFIAAVLARTSAQDVEIAFESTFGSDDVVVEKPIDVIDVSGIVAGGEARAQVCKRLWAAATDVGFFQVANSSLPVELIDGAFAAAEAFFALPFAEKNASAFDPSLNSGYESRTMVRPSMRRADEKEAFSTTPGKAKGHPHLMPSEATVPGFAVALDALYDASHVLCLQLLSCFAEKLGLDPDHFEAALQPRDDDGQTTIAYLHYYPLGADHDARDTPRAGPHTDWTLVTLVFQRAGDDGLQACAGRDAAAGALRWSPVPARGGGVVTVNTGDMLRRWSDDRLMSTVHRVTAPIPRKPSPDRYSIAFFAQANEAAVIAGPGGKYPPISAGDYIKARIASNFGGGGEPAADIVDANAAKAAAAGTGIHSVIASAADEL